MVLEEHQQVGLRHGVDDAKLLVDGADGFSIDALQFAAGAGQQGDGQREAAVAERGDDQLRAQALHDAGRDPLASGELGDARQEALRLRAELDP